MKGQTKLLTGILIGAGLMYLLDPDRGRRRRAIVRDRATSLGRRFGDDVGARSRDLGNRARGVAAELRTQFSRDAVDDERLEERVRAAIGRATSHPSAIQVSAFRGRVTLQGSVLNDEVDGLLSAVRGVHGVDETVNELEVHPIPGSEPWLQSDRSHDRR